MSILVEHAITLTEPWASLMAFDEKRIETRGRMTRFRGWIAIHAAKAFPTEARLLCGRDPFMACLTRHGIHNHEQFKLGHVIAVTRLVNCQPTETLIRSARGAYGNERSFGDYSPGRSGFLTEGVRRLREPFPARGFQSIPWKLPQSITEDMLL